MSTIGLYFITSLLLWGAEEPKLPTAKAFVVNDDFEQWDWIPISFAQRREGRQRLKQGKELPFDHRGPLLRICKGFILPSGKMLEGSEAFKGRSALITDTQVGLHGRYSSKIRPSTKYRYQIALKGKGNFQFRAWVGSNKTTTGEFRWLGFPDLIKISATEKWKVYRGEFQLPDFKFEKNGFRLPDNVSAAIVVDSQHRVAVDEFRVWEVNESK